MKQSTGISAKALIIGAILIPINCYWVVQMEVVHYQGHPTVFSIFFNAILSLFVLVLVSLALSKFFPRLAFTQGELLTIYVMLSVSSGLSGRSMIQLLMPEMGHAFWFATPENEWKDLFWIHIPRWLVVDDMSVLEGYYRGDSSFYALEHLRAWILPLIIWGVFICALVFVILCINVIIRRQWIDNEKLAYPIIQLPLEMTDTDAGLFKNRLMWIGFAIGAGFNLVNGLHVFFPSIPSIRLNPLMLGDFLKEKPWSAMAEGVYGRISPPRPFIVGLGFLIPLDLSFSCWFFFLFYKGQELLLELLGQTIQRDFPAQSFGAYLSLGFFAFWMSRRHFAQIFRNIFARNKITIDNEQNIKEPMSYKTAITGIILGMSFILITCHKAGLSLFYAIIFFALYLMISTAITRMRAELGFPQHDLHFAGPEVLMVDWFGTRRIGARNLTILSFFYFFTRSHHGDVMPHQLEGFKLARRAKIDNRKFLWAIIIAIVLGTLSAFWALLHSFYRVGALSTSGLFGGYEVFMRLQSWLAYPRLTDYSSIGSLAFGLIFGLFLMVMRMRFIWWSFHPAGYAVASSYGMRENVSSLFFSWIIKLCVLKFGGLKLHKQAIPFFLGLILGEFAIGGIWVMLGTVFNIAIYDFTSWY